MSGDGKSGQVRTHPAIIWALATWTILNTVALIVIALVRYAT